MKKNVTEDLKQSILELEKKKAMHLNAMKDEVQETVEKLKPKNLLKTAVENAGTSPDLKNNLINAVIGLGTGYLTRKLFIKGTAGIKGKIAGTVLQYVVANLVAKNSDTLKNLGRKAINFLKSRNKAQDHENKLLTH